jgi:hypothetical protein
VRLRQARHQELQHHFGQVEASNFVLHRHWPLHVGQLLVQPQALAGGFAAGGAGTLARFGETTNELRFAKSASTTNRTPLMVANGACTRTTAACCCSADAAAKNGTTKSGQAKRTLPLLDCGRLAVAAWCSCCIAPSSI